jgi:hypothetical protein
MSCSRDFTLTLLNIHSDAELQRRKLEEPRGDWHVAQEELRQIEFELDDASRVLRRARTQVTLSRERLEKVQDRHWALLSFYNPNQAEEQVDAALSELEELEPAARLNESSQNVDINVEVPPNEDSPSRKVNDIEKLEEVVDDITQ